MKKPNCTLKNAFMRAAGLLTCIAMLSACFDSGPSAQLSAHYILAPVDGGSCSLLNLAGKTIAGPASTKAGLALLEFPADAGMAQLACQGGSYIDEATGVPTPGIPLRSYVNLGMHNLTAMATPLTELTVRTLGTRDPAVHYTALSAAVAGAFGLDGIDLTTQLPDHIGNSALADSKAGRYGAMLATLSQLQLDGPAGAQASAVLDSLAAALTARGRFNDAPRMNSVTDALQNLMSNSRLQAQVADMAERVLREIFEKMQHQTVSATIYYIDTDSSMTQSGEPEHTVAAGLASRIEIVGRNLRLGLAVTLGGAKCQLHDLQSFNEVHVQSEDDLMIADCPAHPAGTAELVIMDDADEASRTTISVTDAPTPAMARAAMPRMAATLARGTGSANLTGTVTAEAPTISVGVNFLEGTARGSLRYDKFRTFPVKGVVVELVEQGAKDTVLLSTVTDQQGQYEFLGAEAGKTVVVHVKAQLLKAADPVSAAGPQWNISVLDNTSTSKPKAMYTLDSQAISLVAGSNRRDVFAQLGFDQNGDSLSADGKSRHSGPFSILEVVNTATIKLQANDPKIKLGELNIYWSVANTTSAGTLKIAEDNKQKGNIDTSHYQGGGTLPGLFILGKANVDTDEFDQGVIGHEFGHYLQDVLSYSDTPGGNHGTTEFKDASLAYGEGYGTAIGGLLTGTPHYTDSSEIRQQTGSATDLRIATKDGVRKGFYSEESVGYLMYALGMMEDGFNRVWRAVAALKNEHHSATVFAFLNQYTKQNPTVAIAPILAQENIRSTDPFGTLAAGLAPDSRIGAAVSGASDLEVQYLNLSLAAGAPTSNIEPVNTNSPSFCISSRLARFTEQKPRPKAFPNTLGLSRRFTFKSTYTGWLLWRPLNDQNMDFNVETMGAEAREEGGKMLARYETPVAMEGGSEIKLTAFKVVEGRVYTIKMTNAPATVWNSHSCGNSVQLLKMAIQP